MQGVKIVAVSGKGGVGKTSFLALALKSLLKSNNGEILVIDGDADSNMPEVLGIDVKKTVGTVVNDFKERMSKMAPGFDKGDYLESLIFDVLQEGELFDLLVMGATEREGCYCSVNNLLTKIMDTLTKNYSYTLLDLPAGLEHVSRRTSKNINYMFLISDASRMGIQTAARIRDLAKALKSNFEHIYLVGNRITPDLESAVKEQAQKYKLEYIGTIPPDDELAQYNLEGKSLLLLPEDNPAYQAVLKIINSKLES
ncbi:MAG: ATP-binding protein [Candidatus Jordarchaeum sp.]|uniref:ATP-binding protein n=1 Tax=Candidatus Jordarchaeum sp. TaxID=2823881 RepID=UPI0040493A1E